MPDGWTERQNRIPIEWILIQSIKYIELIRERNWWPHHIHAAGKFTHNHCWGGCDTPNFIIIGKCQKEFGPSGWNRNALLWHDAPSPINRDNPWKTDGTHLHYMEIWNSVCGENKRDKKKPIRWQCQWKSADWMPLKTVLIGKLKLKYI